MADHNVELMQTIQDCSHMVHDNPECPLYQLFHKAGGTSASIGSG